jgi:uncharacterized membrane protein
MAVPKLPEFWVSKARLETLLDGVFAIAMTLMVLEIRIPDLKDRRSVEEFAAAMRHNIPSVLAFLISMGMLGIFWYRHHRQVHFIARITPGLLALNLGFLTGVAFFPFAAGVVGKYPMNVGVFFVYLPSIFLLTALIALQWSHARRHGLLAPDLDPGAARLIHLENLLGIGMSGGLTVLYLGTILLMRRTGGGT